MTTVTQLTTITYTQSGVAAGLNPATYATMNNGTADGSQNNGETGVPAGDPDWGAWVQADLGAVTAVDHVVVGYDYLNNLQPGTDWHTTFNDGGICGSSDATLPVNQWTPMGGFDTTQATNGIQTIQVAGSYRYLRAYNPGESLGLLEFEIWGALPDTPPPDTPPAAPSTIDPFVVLFDTNETQRLADVAQLHAAAQQQPHEFMVTFNTNESAKLAEVAALRDAVIAGSAIRSGA
jgi:hypothetical protein